MNGDGRFLDALQTTAIFLNRVARIGYLSLTGFAAQLRHQFIKLADTGGTKRVTL